MMNKKHVTWAQLPVKSMQADTPDDIELNNSSVTSPPIKALTSFPEPQITKGRNCYEYVNGKDESRANWMR